jgi:hypothetical protein
MEFNNTGAGASTAQRVNETALDTLITKTQVLGSDYETWIDETY